MAFFLTWLYASLNARWECPLSGYSWTSRRAIVIIRPAVARAASSRLPFRASAASLNPPSKRTRIVAGTGRPQGRAWNTAPVPRQSVRRDPATGSRSKFAAEGAERNGASARDRKGEPMRNKDLTGKAARNVFITGGPGSVIALHATGRAFPAPGRKRPPRGRRCIPGAGRGSAGSSVAHVP